MMPINFGNLFSTTLSSIESYHDTILLITNTSFSFLCNHALNFSNIAIIYMYGSMHFPTICQSGKGSTDSKDYGNYYRL